MTVNVQDQPPVKTSRSWCFTMFDPEEECLSRLKNTPGVMACCVGLEQASTTGREHYQGYIRFEKPVRFSWWKNQYPKTHVEPRKGSEWQAAEYCRKEGNVLIDFGCQVKPPKKDDATLDILEMLEARAPLWQIYRAHRVFFFHNYRKITDMRDFIECYQE